MRVQYNLREYHADLAPLNAMLRAARRGEDYADPTVFRRGNPASPDRALARLAALRRTGAGRDPRLRLTDLAHRSPTRRSGGLCLRSAATSFRSQVRPRPMSRPRSNSP
jgi:hypothetical protein